MGIESLPLQAYSERDSENSVVNSSIELKCFCVMDRWIMRAKRSLKAKGCDEVKASSVMVRANEGWKAKKWGGWTL